MKKVGNPGKPDGEGKEVMLRVRLSPDEFKALKAIAILSNRSMSQVVRDWIVTEP